jgi:hypothetical protein
MNLFVKLSVVTIFLLPTVGAPGWLAGARGHIGFHGVNPYVSVPFGQILKNCGPALSVLQRAVTIGWST